MAATKFKVDDVVLSSSKYSNGQHGIVWKISDYGVHVNFGTLKDPSYQVFHFDPTHHKQSPASEISIVIDKTLQEVIDLFPDGFDDLYVNNPYAKKCVHFLQQKDDPYYLLDYILKVNQELMVKISDISDYIGNPPLLKK